MAATMSEIPRSVSFELMGPQKNQRSQSTISIGLMNEKGENDLLEIDEPDDVFQEIPKQKRSPQSEKKSLNETHVRRLSIADRVNRRRNSEFAFEFTRLAALGRAEDFFRLLDEHSRLVHSVQFWSTAASMQDGDVEAEQRPRSD